MNEESCIPKSRDMSKPKQVCLCFIFIFFFFYIVISLASELHSAEAQLSTIKEGGLKDRKNGRKKKNGMKRNWGKD